MSSYEQGLADGQRWASRHDKADLLLALAERDVSVGGEAYNAGVTDAIKGTLRLRDRYRGMEVRP